MRKPKTAAKQMQKQMHHADWERIDSDAQWARGRLIANWIASRRDATASRFVREFGGVTAAEFGRLRRVHHRFYYRRHLWPGLSWAHFATAEDWDDAEHWLNLAKDMGWDAEQMRIQRWEART